MKRRMLIAGAMMLAITLGTISAKAQDVKDKNYLNAGVGLGTFGLLGKGGLPINVSYERGFTNQISGGIYAAIVKRTYAGDWKYKYRIIGLRASYHFNQLLKITDDKVEVYGGATIYHRGFSLTYDGGEAGIKKEKDGSVGLGLHAGGRYMFANNIGAFAEVGVGISPLQLGLTLKF